MKKGDNDIIKVLGELDEKLVEEANPYRTDAEKKAAASQSDSNGRSSSAILYRLRIVAGIAAAAVVLVIGIVVLKKGLTNVKPGNDNKPGAGHLTATATPGIGDATTPTPEPFTDTPTPTMEVPRYTPTPEVPQDTPTPTGSQYATTPTPTMTPGVASPTPTPSARREELTEESADWLIRDFYNAAFFNWNQFDKIYVLVFPEDKIEEISGKYRADYGMPQDCTLYEYVEEQHRTRRNEIGSPNAISIQTPGSQEMSLQDAGPEIQRLIREDGVELPMDAKVCVETVSWTLYYDEETIEGTRQICVYSYNGCLYIAGIRVDEWM